MNLQFQIARRIKKLRREKGFSQPQMAELLHIDKSAYARLESGKTYSWAKHLEELLNIFQITLEKFFKDVESNTVTNNTTFPNDEKNEFNIQNLYQESHEAFEKLLAAKDEQIALLKSLSEKL
jgi:transcriptional regulator with XRE-family HTH domain